MVKSSLFHEMTLLGAASRSGRKTLPGGAIEVSLTSSLPVANLQETWRLIPPVPCWLRSTGTSTFGSPTISNVALAAGRSGGQGCGALRAPSDSSRRVRRAHARGTARSSPASCRSAGIYRGSRSSAVMPCSCSRRRSSGDPGHDVSRRARARSSRASAHQREADRAVQHDVVRRARAAGRAARSATPTTSGAVPPASASVML